MSSPLSPQVQEAMRLADEYAKHREAQALFYRSTVGGGPHAEHDVNERRAALLAHLSAVPFNPPEGMVLVPREPTPEMMDAAVRQFSEEGYTANRQGIDAVYRAMLEAAPEPVSQPGEGKKWQRLYTAVNELMAYMGAHGSAEAKGDRASAVMDALHAIDGGEPEEALPAEQPKSDKSYPVVAVGEINKTALPRWEPIATAPKDGRTIRLGFMEAGEVTQTAEMQWSHIQRNGLFPGAVGMWVCSGGNFTWSPEPAEFGPSHWQPIEAQR